VADLMCCPVADMICCPVAELICFPRLVSDVHSNAGDTRPRQTTTRVGRYQSVDRRCIYDASIETCE